MPILVTGATGRIGANLVKGLVDAGHRVRALALPGDARVSKLQGLDVEIVYGTVAYREDVAEAMRGVEAVYHLAGVMTAPWTPPQLFDGNIRGMFNLLEEARAHGRLRRFIWSSTDAVYEKYIPGGMTAAIDQDVTPRRPADLYSMSKAVGEEMAAAYQRGWGVPVVTFRFPVVLAGDEALTFWEFWLEPVLARARAGAARGDAAAARAVAQLESLGAGAPRLLLARDEAGVPYRRHPADVRDIVQALLLALTAEAAVGETIQLAGPEPWDYDRAIPLLSAALGVPAVEARLPGVPTRYWHDIGKARRLLGYAPVYDLPATIASAVAFRAGDRQGVIGL
jgi:nucleoside-diphosphate-sugar epimerase